MPSHIMLRYEVVKHVGLVDLALAVANSHYMGSSRVAAIALFGMGIGSTY